MRRHLRYWGVPVILAALLESPAQGQPQVYTDANQYFMAVPPQQWQREDYPSEQVRSKVAYHPPREPQVTISIIAAPAPDPIPSFDQWYGERERRVAELRRRFPTGRITLEKSRFGDHSAILMKMSIPREVEQEVILVMPGRLQYTLTYSAPTSEGFGTHRAAFDRFVGDFVPLGFGRRFSQRELTDTRVAFKKALAKSSEAIGDRQAALAFVNQGLEIAPQDPELQQMKLRLSR